MEPTPVNSGIEGSRLTTSDKNILYEIISADPALMNLHVHRNVTAKATVSRLWETTLDRFNSQSGRNLDKKMLESWITRLRKKEMKVRMDIRDGAIDEAEAEAELEELFLTSDSGAVNPRPQRLIVEMPGSTPQGWTARTVHAASTSGRPGNWVDIERRSGLVLARVEKTMMSGKRSRNFNEDETRWLMSIIVNNEQLYKIIRSTNSGLRYQKEKAWKFVHDKFMERFPSATFTQENLKTRFRNILQSENRKQDNVCLRLETSNDGSQGAESSEENESTQSGAASPPSFKRKRDASPSSAKVTCPMGAGTSRSGSERTKPSLPSLQIGNDCENSHTEEGGVTSSRTHHESTNDVACTYTDPLSQDDHSTSITIHNHHGDPLSTADSEERSDGCLSPDKISSVSHGTVAGQTAATTNGEQQLANGQHFMWPESSSSAGHGTPDFLLNDGGDLPDWRDKLILRKRIFDSEEEPPNKSKSSKRVEDAEIELIKARNEREAMEHRKRLDLMEEEHKKKMEYWDELIKAVKTKELHLPVFDPPEKP